MKFLKILIPILVILIFIFFSLREKDRDIDEVQDVTAIKEKKGTSDIKKYSYDKPEVIKQERKELPQKEPAQKLDSKDLDDRVALGTKLLNSVFEGKEEDIPEILEYLADDKNGEAIVDMISAIREKASQSFKEEILNQAIEILEKEPDNLTINDNYLSLVAQIGEEKAFEAIISKTQSENKKIKYFAYTNTYYFKKDEVNPSDYRRLYDQMTTDLDSTEDNTFKNSIYNKMVRIATSSIDIDENEIQEIENKLTKEIKAQWEDKEILTPDLQYLSTELYLLYRNIGGRPDLMQNFKESFPENSEIWKHLDEKEAKLR